MFKRSQVAEVDLTIFRENPVWLQICTYALLTNPDVGRDPVFLCDYCRPKVRSGIMPGRCALNGLHTEPFPDELKGLDPFSSPLIQGIQIVVRLGRYNNKEPLYIPESL